MPTSEPGSSAPAGPLDSWARQMAGVIGEELRLQRRLIRLEQDIAAEAAEEDALARRRDELERAIAASSAELAALEHELALLRASWSWRFTAPLRRAATWLRRLLGRP